MSRKGLRWVGGAIAAAVIVAVPLIGVGKIDTAFAVDVLLLGIAATGLNLLFGYMGMLSLGHAAFLGLAGYAVGIAVHQWSWPVEAAIPLAVVVGAAASLVLGFLFVRLSGFYFSVATLGLAVALEGLVRAYPHVTGGASGLTISRHLDLGLFEVASDTQWFLFMLAVSVVVGLAVIWVVSARTGRLLRLVHRDQLAAAVMGVDVLRARLVVFVISGAVTSLAGALLFVWRGVIVPESGGLIQSVELAGVVVVGGAGYAVGGFVGAFGIDFIQSVVSSFGEFEQLTYGIVFLLVVFYLQSGLSGAVVDLVRLVADRWPGRSPAEPGAAHRGDTPDARGSAEVELQVLTGGRETGGLVVDAVTRRFGGVTAVDNASLAAPLGSITGLIGTNGAGKSTLLNLVSGVEVPDDGRVVLDGVDITRRSPAERARLGIVRTFQVPRLVEHLSVIENVALGLDASGGRVFSKAGSTASVERAREVLAAAGLSGLEDRRAATLGTGERKFVELVRALAGSPAVVLMDEPAVGLSTFEIERLTSWLLELRDRGAAVVLVDHNLDFVGAVADATYEMVNGVVSAPRPAARSQESRPAATPGGH